MHTGILCLEAQLFLSFLYVHSLSRIPLFFFSKPSFSFFYDIQTPFPSTSRGFLCSSLASKLRSKTSPADGTVAPLEVLQHLSKYCSSANLMSCNHFNLPLTSTLAHQSTSRGSYPYSMTSKLLFHPPLMDYCLLFRPQNFVQKCLMRMVLQHLSKSLQQFTEPYCSSLLNLMFLHFLLLETKYYK